MLLFDCSVLELRFEKNGLRLMQNLLTINGKEYNMYAFFIFEKLY